MIGQVWHRWRSAENADAYEALLKPEVFPGILAKQVPSFQPDGDRLDSVGDHPIAPGRRHLLARARPSETGTGGQRRSDEGLPSMGGDGEGSGSDLQILRARIP